MTNKITKFAVATVIIFAVLILFRTKLQALLLNAQPVPVVAQLTDSIDAVWDNNLQSPNDDGLMIQSTYRLTDGYVSIKFNGGAVITVEAPAEFSLLSAGDMELFIGSIYAVVPEKAVGFTVAAANSKIVDLGTEFGVEVDINGNTELHVTKGKTILFNGLNTRARSQVNVNAGSAKRVYSDGFVKNIPFVSDKFIKRIDSSTGLTSK